MGGCRCSYRNCKSATKISENLHFFHYPVKHTERCKQWILNANKPNFFDLSEDQLRNKVVCELHFEDRSFTNFQKKRLLHDAIPTLDGDSQDEQISDTYSNQRNYEDVQVLPANADGTIFMVDTDSMQQLSESEKIESYILRDGSVIPSDTQVIYTTVQTSDDDITLNSSNNKNSFLNNISNDIFSQQVEDNGNMKIIYNSKGILDSNSEISYFDNTHNNSNEIQQNDYSIEIRKDSDEIINKKYYNNIRIRNKKQVGIYRQLKQNSKDIASLKKLVQNNMVKKSYNNKTFILKYLKRYLPSTLYSMVNICLNPHKIQTLREDEVNFFKTFNSTSIDLYDLLKRKYEWPLPEIKEKD